MRKFKFFINFDKEEQWLNDMAKQGYKFINKSSRYEYEFQPAERDDAVIKIDYRTLKKRADFEDYCALFEDSGWQHITGTKRSGFHYFKKIDENSDHDIFSDVDSKAGRYQRISVMWLSLATSFLPILIILTMTGAINVSELLNPKLLYYTPGLWEKNGVNFWGAFLFETPFALFRGFLWTILPFQIILYLLFAFKANRQYHKTQGNL